jgi:hypothetical protein
MFALGVVSIEIWPTEMPVWAFVIALLIGESLRSLHDKCYYMNVHMPFSVYLCDSMRHDTGDHQSADWVEVRNMIMDGILSLLKHILA